MTAVELLNVLIAALALVVGVIAARLSYLALFPTRREIVHGVEVKYRILNAPAGAEGLTLRLGDRVLHNPYVVEYALRATGRADIAPEDFTEDALHLTFTETFLADLTPRPDGPGGPEVLAYGPPGSGPPDRLVIRPSPMRCGRRYRFVLLFDGDPESFRASLPDRGLRNVRIIPKREHAAQMLRKRTSVAYVGATGFAAAGVIAAAGPLGTPNPLAGLILVAAAVAPLSLGLVLDTRRP